MYLMYVDESGDSGLPSDGSPTRYFCLSGLVVHELRWRAVLAELTSFRHWLRKRYNIRTDHELHHAEMVGKAKKLAASIRSLDKHDRLAVIRHHADELSRLTDLNVINIVVDKASGKLADKEAVFRGAWYRLFQRFENTIEMGNFPGPRNDSDRGIIFPDDTDGERLKSYLNDMRARNPIKLAGIPGSFHFADRPVKFLIEDPIMRDSNQSYFVQAADLCVFLLKQAIEPSGYMKKQGGKAYFQRMEPILCKHASRSDPMGIVRL